jgi:hypothetical protein
VPTIKWCAVDRNDGCNNDAVNVTFGCARCDRLHWVLLAVLDAIGFAMVREPTDGDVGPRTIITVQ